MTFMESYIISTIINSFVQMYEETWVFRIEMKLQNILENFVHGSLGVT